MSTTLPIHAATGEAKDDKPRCPACARPVTHHYLFGYAHPGAREQTSIRESDALWHLDSTLAVDQEGKVACDGSGTCAHSYFIDESVGCHLCGAPHPRFAITSASLDNQGRPVHDDQESYASARAELLRGAPA